MFSFQSAAWHSLGSNPRVFSRSRRIPGLTRDDRSSVDWLHFYHVLFYGYLVFSASVWRWHRYIYTTLAHRHRLTRINAKIETSRRTWACVRAGKHTITVSLSLFLSLTRARAHTHTHTHTVESFAARSVPVHILFFCAVFGCSTAMPLSGTLNQSDFPVYIYKQTAMRVANTNVRVWASLLRNVCSWSMQGIVNKGKFLNCATTLWHVQTVRNSEVSNVLWKLCDSVYRQANFVGLQSREIELFGAVVFLCQSVKCVECANRELWKTL